MTIVSQISASASTAVETELTVEIDEVEREAIAIDCASGRHWVSAARFWPLVDSIERFACGKRRVLIGEEQAIRFLGEAYAHTSPERQARLMTASGTHAKPQ